MQEKQPLDQLQKKFNNILNNLLNKHIKNISPQDFLQIDQTVQKNTKDILRWRQQRKQDIISLANDMLFKTAPDYANYISEGLSEYTKEYQAEMAQDIIKYIEKNKDKLFTESLYQKEKNMSTKTLKDYIAPQIQEDILKIIRTKIDQKVPEKNDKIEKKQKSKKQKLKEHDQMLGISPRELKKEIEQQRLWDEHAELKKQELEKWMPIMVLAYDSPKTHETIVLKTIEDYAHERQGNLGMFLTRDSNESHAVEVNKRVNEAVKEAISSKKLRNITPSPSDDGKIKYSHGSSHLSQEEINGKFKFKPEGKFTGILKVERENANGELLPNQVDIVEYKDGKPIAVTQATQGKSRIADIGLLQKQARGISVISPEQQVLKGIEVHSTQRPLPPYKPPPIPRKSNPPKRLSL